MTNKAVAEALDGQSAAGRCTAPCWQRKRCALHSDYYKRAGESV